MSKNFESYIDEVIERIGITGKKAREIREDLYISLTEKEKNTGESNPYMLMGDPREVAEEFIENLEIDSSSYKNDYFYFGRTFNFEYTSKTKVFGVPLVHVNCRPFGVARGILAIGFVSVGVLSIGCISLGIIGLGAVALSILFSAGGIGAALGVACGGVAISGLASFGGAAVSGLISFGGAAISKYLACGGYARADIAIGGVAKGIVAVYKQSGSGQYAFKFPANTDEVIKAVKLVKPSASKWMIDFIRSIIQGM